ncbi:MAG: hypothetical protein EBT03_10525 [Betaproteobacteria bacterium]|nr:hypothetical protein [Betaproteobacteria bacterium]NCA16894.1 hypothetical protein [Betaproteobacteria bacterium]
MLLAIDPGKKHLGVALFENGRLVALDELKLPRKDEWTTTSPWRLASAVDAFCAWHGKQTKRVTDCVIEFPQIYDSSREKGDPNKSIRYIHTNIGALLVLFQNADLIEPQRWKGTIDGDKMISRALGKLDATERTLTEEKTHNAHDAVGLGLWRVKRLHLDRP